MLHVHRAARADGLVDALGALLLERLPNPFEPEVVAVPTRGIERWLSQRLSAVLGASDDRADGVCANVDFPSPRALVADSVAAACGVDPDRDRWTPERLVWPLLDVVDDCIGEPWLAVLATHLQVRDGIARGARRLKAARHLAQLFDRYALHRPGLVRGWAAGDDDRWQAELWRHLRARLDTPSLAERLGDAAARLTEDPTLVTLPERLSIFGLTRLPAGHLEVLQAIASHRELHLFLLHPSPVLWSRVAAMLDPAAPIVQRVGDPTVTAPRDRLLASWGQDAREMQLVLAGAEAADHLHERDHPPAHTLLARLQAAVRDDVAAPGPPAAGEIDGRPLLDPADHSLQIHACHGRARQVEVLRDAVLHLLQDDDSLEPRDIIVMCPDIEVFAPLIHATFGAAQPDIGDADDEIIPERRPLDLRVRLADRSLRQTNPVLGVAARLLELAERRCSASEVLDLADRVPVRRRFGLDDDELARLQEWVAQSGIRWGLDAAHRAPYKLGQLEDGTWRAGLDRILLGVAMTEDGCRRYGDVLPVDDVEGRAIGLAGRFTELVERLAAALHALAGPLTAPGWADAIADATVMLCDVSPRNAWQLAGLQRLLGDVADEATGAEGTRLSLPEARALLAGRWEGAATRANFRTGHLTVCTMLPMRSVPHRVVCLLGLDDDVFPRHSARDGDDLMLDDPHVGERDPRREDRQLLLDALMAAGDRLVVTYTGRDERSNEPRPPAVPIGELLDAVDRAVCIEGGDRAREGVVIDHPLQPFDPRNYARGALRPGGSWSFDAVTLDGARAVAGERHAPPPFLGGPLPARAGAVVELDELADFAGRPVRAFLRRRLQISVARYDDEIDDALPVELDGLARYAVGQRLLDAVRRGVALDDAVAAERARGSLPPGTLADAVVGHVRPVVEQLAAAAEQELGERGAAGAADVRLELPGGRLLSGTVTGLHGDLLLAVAYAKVDPRHRLAAWVRWLALTAAHPEWPVAAVTIGRAREGAKRAQVTIVRLSAPPGEPVARSAFALEQLAVLADLYDRGMREPLPLACRTSAAYARAATRGNDPVEAARAQWTSRFKFDGEDRQPEHKLAFGGEAPFDDLLVAAPRDDEHGDGWEHAEATRFGRLARRLWAGPVAREEFEDQ